jgi:hypothetical protein
MGLLSKLTGWTANLFGGGDSDGSTAEDETDETDEAADSAGDRDGPDEHTVDRLDPGAATERRAAATDDAVDALRDVRRSQEEREADRSGAEPPTDPEPAGDQGRS